MKIKHLLILLLIALAVPLAVNAQSSLPFSENFNSVPVDQLPTNWVLSSTHIGEVAAVVQKETSTSTNRILVMGVTQLQNGNGALTVQIPANAIGKYYVKLSFKLMPTKATSGTFKVVCASTSFTNPIEVATYNASDLNVGSWNYITVPVALPSSKTITFMVTTTTANTGWAIDDVSVTDGYKPTNVTTSVLEPNYATISWDYSGTSSYEMRYHMQGETDWTTVTSSSNHYAISELLTNTSYEAQVRGVEGFYYTGWSDLLTFTTPDAFYNFYIAIQNSDRYLYYKVTNSENHYVKVVSPFNSFGDPWGTFAKPEGNVIIPQTVTYGGVTYTVTDIGNYALKGCTGVTGISIPSTITSIGNYAFYNCKLSSLVIPSSVTEINQYAFNNCGNDNGMTVNIAGDATTGTRIETMAFMNSKVSELTLGEGVVFVGEKAFWGCPLLTTVHFNATNCTQMRSTYNSAYYSVFNSGNDITTHPAITTLTIGNNVTNIPDYAFYDFTSLTEVTISEGVTSIGNQAFWSCPNLTTVNFNATNCTSMQSTYNDANYSVFNSGSDNTTDPAVTTLNIGNNVTIIPGYAFYGFTSLPEVTISEGVTSIGNQAFWSCPNLTTVNFNATNCTSMESVDNQNYHYSVFNSGSDYTTRPAVTTLNIGNNVTNIPAYAFAGANLITNLSIPISVQHIHNDAFEGCTGINTLHFDDGSQLRSIGTYAFYGCTGIHNLILTLPNLESIDYMAFAVCSFNIVYIIGSEINIGQYAFYRSGSPNWMIVTTNVKSIGYRAFYESNIEELTIGEGVTSIGKEAFWNCPNLTTVHFNAVNCTEMAYLYEDTNGSTYYRSVFNGSGTWNGSNSYPRIQNLTIGDNVTRIPYFAFTLTNDIQELTIPVSVKYIDEGAFFACSGLTALSLSVDQPQLITIGNYAFYECNNLTGYVQIPGSVEYIGNYAFASCFLSGLYIPESVTEIGEGAFYECGHSSGMNVWIIGNDDVGTIIGEKAFSRSTVKGIDIREGVTVIGERAFEYCSKLEHTIDADGVFELPQSITEIRDYAFHSCSGLNALKFYVDQPQLITIGNYAFYECNNLTEYVQIPGSVEYIGNYAFASCFLGGLYIPESVTEIGEGAFYECGHSSGMNVWIIGNDDVGTIIGEKAFSYSTVKGIDIREGVTVIGDRAFEYCSKLEHTIDANGVFELPQSLTEIGHWAFRNCAKLVNVNIPSNKTVGTFIGDFAFKGCSLLEEVTIGEGVTSIGHQAFWNCPNLTTVHFNAVNCISMNTTYSDGDNNHYRSAFNSGEDLTTGPVITTLTIGENVTNIPGYAFYDCQTASVQLNIPNVTAVGDGAFYNCLLATNLNLGNSVVTIGMKAFENCNNITGDLIIPNTTTFIGASAFCNAGLNGMLVLGQNVNSLGAAAFKNCNFTSIIIGRGNVSEPNNITTAEANTFEGVRSYIPVYRPFGTNYPTATGWNHFTNYLTEYQHNGGAWSVASNWLQNSVPGADDVVLINGNSHISANESQTVKYLYFVDGSYQKLTIKSNAQLTVTDALLNNDATKLVIDDGGQLFASSMAFEGTAKRSITGFGDMNNSDGWYTIASPFNGGSVDQVTTGNYDLYTYDEPTSYWLNQKEASHHIDMFNPKKGYLYANQATTEIALKGTFDPSDIDLNSATVKYTSEAGNLAGFNLLGNPYTHNINIGDVTMGGDAFTQYYTVRGGSGLMAYTASDNQPIKVGEGFFVKVTSNGTVNFNGATRGERADDSYLRLVLSDESRMSDRAYLRLNDGDVLEKLVIGDAQSLLYFEQHGSRYAIASHEANVNEVALFFVPASDGVYTINAALLDAECDYLHLIDNLTGADIDLLQQPEYTFNAKYSDYPSRFKLVFAQGSSEQDNNFAFIRDGHLVLFGIDGTATLQVIDMLGHVLSTEQFSGSYDKQLQATSGVYVLRLINGDNVKTQKIVIE